MNSGSEIDFPPEKTSEIKPTGTEESKVLNATMDDSSQKKRVAPDCDDVMEFPPSEIKTAGIEESKVLNATMDDSSQNKQVVPDYDDVVDSPPEASSETKPSSKDCLCLKPGESSSQDAVWEAIEKGEISALKKAIQEMKESEGGSSALLDTCHLIEKSGVTYSMSLLALCGIHGKEDMVDLLLKEGADMNAKCSCVKHTGTPILQMMLHCLMQNNCDKLNVTMLQYFTEKVATLSGEITTRHLDIYYKGSEGVKYGMLDLPLSMQRIDCAKVLVKAGVDLVNGGSPEGEEFAVVPMFQEYLDHGTNKFIRWAFNEYAPKHPEIDLRRIIHSVINMNKKDERSCFWQSVQRAQAHALLTSHHEETIKHLVQFGKECGLDLLDERSCTGKTALHVAAEDNDVKSVQILLKLGADIKARDNSDMNPFMLAVANGHLEVMKTMIEKDPGLMSFQTASELKIIYWALEKDHCCAFFKCCFEKNPEALLKAKDSQGNTIAHLVAASGKTEVFQILWSEEFADAIFSKQNSEDKTPLHLAVEKEHIGILKTLQTCVDKGREEAIPPRWHRKLKAKWWSKVIPYFLYACSCGSLRAVECFIASGHKPNSSGDSGKTPLLCAAEAGHDEVVAYLLQFREVQTALKSQPLKVSSASASPLLIAAQNGHTRCVTLLLQNGDNVLQSDYKGRNCLMIATQNHHKATALAILSGSEGSKALQMPTHIRLSHSGESKQNLAPVQKFLQRKLKLNQLFTKKKKDPTPLQLLVKEMPDLAEYLLNKCITQDEPAQQIKRQNSSDVKGNSTAPTDQPVHYNFEYLEGMDKDHENPILDCMIKHNRLELLQHPLVENFLLQKFWVMTFPLLLLHLMFYLTFLVTLNSFAVVVPRPGPDSETCRESDTVAMNDTSSECLGQSNDDRNFLTAATYILCILSFFGLFFELVQLVNKETRYFKYFDNYFRVPLYISTTIFILWFDNACWCSNPWQWQIGAFAVFLSWINFIFILKYMPYVIAGPINMFLSICVKFLQLILLPVLLILAFGVPHYMVFEVGNLTAFRSPGHAVAKTLLQLVGEFDFEATFNQGALLYTPAAYILFITFLITMPVLFTNLLIGLAVGDTQKEQEKAEFTKFKVWVEFVLEQERNRAILNGLHMQCKKSVYHPKPKSDGNDTSDKSHKNNRLKDNGSLNSDGPRSDRSSNNESEDCFVLTLFGKEFGFGKRFVTFFLKMVGKEYSRHAEIAKECKKGNVEIYRKVMEQTTVDDVREDISELKDDIKQRMMAQATIDDVREDVSELKEDFKQKMMVLDVREDMNKFKEDIHNLKHEMAKILQALTSRREMADSSQ